MLIIDCLSLKTVGVDLFQSPDQSGIPDPDHEQTAIEIGDQQQIVGEKGKHVPGAAEACPVAGRVGIEEGNLAKIGAGRVDQFEHPQSTLVVGLKNEIPGDIQVVVDRQTICDVFRGLRGAVESLKVKNQRSCTGQIERKFIDLVVE